MADARTLPVDDTGQLIVVPHGVAVPEVAMDEHWPVIRYREAPQDVLRVDQQLPGRFAPTHGAEVDRFDRTTSRRQVRRCRDRGGVHGRDSRAECSQTSRRRLPR
jgi:hypothetical protein